ncbi:MAG TPA: serine/threonine-protein kinase [Gemmatimonadales bacterium]|nr:serine/threonine-protein kinase [Gemmatimonadales bacterium]
MVQEPEQLVGRTIGPYTLDRLIGQGGFAWVFAAYDASTGNTAAVKVLRPRYAGDEQFATRFRNEAKVATELQHPNIVRVLDVGESDDLTYFAMDYYPDTLAARLSRGGPLPEAELIRVAADVVQGLSFAHQAGIVHRDIKVDNIMFTLEGNAVIADFGIARAVSGYVTATGVNMTIGTAAYVSPEQAQGRPLDGRSDLYALGVTLYKAATGEVPFRSTDWFELARMHVEVPPESPRAKNPAVSRRLERIILKCLAKHPDDRYDSAAHLLTELEAIQQEARRTESFGVGPSTMMRAMKTPQRPGRPAWLMALAGILVVVLAALLVIVFGSR